MSSVLDDLRRVVQVLRESSRTAQQSLGVSGAQLFVLKALAGPVPSSLNALAERTHTHQSTVSVVVKRLVTRKLVARTVSSRDARQVELRLTAAGRALLRRAPGAAQQRLIDGLERISPGELEKLASALHGLVAAMGLAAQEPAMFFEPRRRTKKTKSRSPDAPAATEHV
jgi:DNA-binding MarR family transcriptional regulator